MSRLQTSIFEALAIAALGACACSVATAEDDAISTDRPDFVESSDVVSRGTLQIETGIGYERDSNAAEPTRTYTTPTLFRVGIGYNVELRLETDGWTSQRTTTASGSTTETGYSDVSLGAKWHLADSDAARGKPALAMLLHADIDSGSSAFRGVGIRPSLRGVAEWELGETTSLGVMPGVVYDQTEQHRFFSGLLAVTSGHQFTANLRGFIEIAGQQFAHAEDGGVILTYDAGVTYLLSKSMQLDCAISRGANRNTPEWSAGAGFSIRL
jgi:hypothetical protein